MSVGFGGCALELSSPMHSIGLSHEGTTRANNEVEKQHMESVRITKGFEMLLFIRV